NNISIAISGSGRDVPAYRAMLGGLSRINREYPNLHIFLELRGTGQHEIWRYAQKLKLMGRISCLSDASPNRRLLTQCDMMLLPERYGELYSIMLEAMANGMAIIASHDSMLDMLRPDETALQADTVSPEEWANLIRRSIQDPEASRQLGHRARAWVKEHHSTNTQVDALIEALNHVVTGGTYSFAEAAETAN
ncbi:MAG: glycosyltransferase, partial [Planctomycetota bacterium]|nr:glycosyltransferase [Planctomycetota bacterium]